MSYKIVQNYQLSESNSYIEDGIQVYIAQHNVTKLPYLLKKVQTKDSSDKVRYQSLLNEIGILKILSNPLIVQCHKMLKTSNNIYLVYDYCNGSPLQEIIKTASKEIKINIIKQLIQVLRLMANSSIVHCNLKPSSIIVSNEKKIKVFNFTHGHNRQNKKTVNVKFKPSNSNYVAPQIIKQNIAHEKSDIYSFGVIINQMNLGTQTSYLAAQNNINMGKLQKLVQMMMSQSPDARPDLQQIASVFKSNQQLSPMKKSGQIDKKSPISLSPSSSLRRGNSQNSDTQKKTLSPNSSNQQVKINQKRFVQQILKRRNLAIFLLQMSQTCLKVQQDQKKLGIFLSYIFMKKSYKVINGVLGYLKGEAGYEKQIDKKFLDKNERLAFQKKADYFKIFSIIQKQAGNQKRWLQDIHKNISPQLPNKFKQLTLLQQLDDKSLLNYIVQFLIYLIKQSSQTEQINNKIAQNLYLMSEIIPHKSFQKMFEQMISQQKISLDQQYLYIHVRKMDKKQLISQISARIKGK